MPGNVLGWMIVFKETLRPFFRQLHEEGEEGSYRTEYLCGFQWLRQGFEAIHRGGLPHSLGSHEFGGSPLPTGLPGGGFENGDDGHPRSLVSPRA